MDFGAYKDSLVAAAPPEGLGPAVEALWWEKKGDWHRAHQCAQQQGDADGAWVHAYLHRVEGDLRNATGWYGRAGRPVSTIPPRAKATVTRTDRESPSRDAREQAQDQ